MLKVDSNLVGLYWNLKLYIDNEHPAIQDHTLSRKGIKRLVEAFEEIENCVIFQMEDICFPIIHNLFYFFIFLGIK